MVICGLNTSGVKTVAYIISAVSTKQFSPQYSSKADDEVRRLLLVVWHFGLMDLDAITASTEGVVLITVASNDVRVGVEQSQASTSLFAVENS